ncbi:unnamed protein product [Absidia cylindrospora]
MPDTTQGIMEEQRQDAERKAKWKKKNDQGIMVVLFPVGSQVLLREIYAKGKFEDTWIGPYTIIKTEDGSLVPGAMLKPWYENNN